MIAALFALLVGQAQGQATIVQTSPSPTPPMQTSMGPVQAAFAGHHDLSVNVLSNDTVVVIKDVGDSQIVMVYRVDAAGKVQLMHKVRFYY